MAKTISPREDDPDIIDDACCPRCGRDVRPIKRIRDTDYNTVGFRVRHADHDAPCSSKEWPIYDPEQVDGEQGLPSDPYENGGLSICRRCLSWVQHITHDGYDEDGNGVFEIVAPPRDDDGDIICPRCEARLEREIPESDTNTDGET